MNAAPTSTGSAPRSRIRFSLRATFVLVTIVCVLLGWMVIRYRRAERIIARHLAVVDQIQANVSQPPSNVTFVMPANVRQTKTALYSKMRANQVYRQFHTNGWLADRFDHMTQEGELLDVSAALVAESADDLATRLRAHYEDGFSSLGLRRNLTVNGDPASAIWASPDNCIQLVVDVDVDGGDKSARARVIYLHHEAMELW
ncbi:MAG: hypothetical protein AB7G28_04705 [Pirellulales bacterium]